MTGATKEVVGTLEEFRQLLQELAKVEAEDD